MKDDKELFIWLKVEEQLRKLSDKMIVTAIKKLAMELEKRQNDR